MTRHVDDGIERRASERREPVRFVTVHADETRAVRYRTGDAARRAGHVMAVRQGMRRNRAPEKLRAAEDQQAHWFPPRLICKSNFISSHRRCRDDGATEARPRRTIFAVFEQGTAVQSIYPRCLTPPDAALVRASRDWRVAVA